MISLILTIYLIIVFIFFIFSLQYRDKVDNFLTKLKISTFNALWLSYLEGLIIGGLSKFLD